MRNRIITEDSKRYLVIIGVPETLTYGFISKTGASFTYRVIGEWLGSNGVVKGEEGRMSTYINHSLPERVTPLDRSQLRKSDIVKMTFEDFTWNCLKIRIGTY